MAVVFVIIAVVLIVLGGLLTAIDSAFSSVGKNDLIEEAATNPARCPTNLSSKSRAVAFASNPMVRRITSPRARCHSPSRRSQQPLPERPLPTRWTWPS